jgi:hypothetical protein
MITQRIGLRQVHRAEPGRRPEYRQKYRQNQVSKARESE